MRLVKLGLTSIQEAMITVPEMAQQLSALSIQTRNSFVNAIHSHKKRKNVYTQNLHL